MCFSGRWLGHWCIQDCKPDDEEKSDGQEWDKNIIHKEMNEYARTTQRKKTRPQTQPKEKHFSFPMSEYKIENR